MEYIGLFSGGKDSLTACHYLWKQGKLNEVLYCRTGVGLNEDYVVDMCKKFDWKLNIVEPAPFEYETFCQRYGFPSPTSHTWIMQRLKLNPIRKWHGKESKKRDIVFASGIRLAESKRLRKFAKGDKLEKITKMRFHKPILDWSNAKVLDYIKKWKLETSPIYQYLSLSGDCMCGAFCKRDQALIISRQFPVLAERLKELEAHVRGHWGSFMSITDCQKQGDLDDLICSECMVEPMKDG